jgi:hypothetical protein
MWEGWVNWVKGEQMGSVYKHPEREVDDSCHNWRVPSKWKGAQRGGKGELSKGSKGSKGNCAMYICNRDVCTKSEWTIRLTATAYITMNECPNNMLSCI